MSEETTSVAAPSEKRTAILKANAQMVIIVSVASFVTIFCLVAAKTVLGQMQYQNRIISAKNTAKTQLVKDVSAASQLTSSYKTFVSQSTNIIGGSNTGSGPNDGDNAKIILDALPSTYDFPALTSSLEQILNSQSVSNGNITGTDEQLTQGSDSSSTTPQPVSMPFGVSVSGSSYTALQNLVNHFQQSIRPIAIDTLTLSGADNNMSATIQAHTYYQPALNFSVTKKVVK